jgi:hypothetical protein
LPAHERPESSDRVAVFGDEHDRPSKRIFEMFPCKEFWRTAKRGRLTKGCLEKVQDDGKVSILEEPNRNRVVSH